MTQVSRRAAAKATVLGNSLTVGITVAQAFLLIPLCLKFLGAELYGAWLAGSELLIWVQLIDGGLPNLLMQRAGAAMGRDDREAAARWASTCLAGQAIIGLALCAGAVVAAPAISAWLQVPPVQHDRFVACFRVGALASLGLMLANGCVGLARGVQRTALITATQVAGALFGLLLSIALLVAGWGLWALAVGLLARAAVAFGGGVLFLRTLPQAGASWWRHPSRHYARDIRSLVPSMSLASVSHVLAHNSEILLVTTFFGSAPALAYALTRRAFDGARNLLDTITWSVSGGFAHLVATSDRHRARTVFREILWLRLSAACVAMAVLVAVNQPFVNLLFGSAHFGGIWLTVLFALQTIVSGHSFLVNFLWRSMGDVQAGSLALVIEMAARVGAMAVGLAVMGLGGAPLAATAVAGLALLLMRPWVDRALPPGGECRLPWPTAVAPLCVLGIGIAAAIVQVPPSWLAVGAVVAIGGPAAGSWLWFMRPLTSEGESLLRWNRR